MATDASGVGAGAAAAGLGGGHSRDDGLDGHGDHDRGGWLLAGRRGERVLQGLVVGAAQIGLRVAAHGAERHGALGEGRELEALTGVGGLEGALGHLERRRRPAALPQGTGPLQRHHGRGVVGGHHALGGLDDGVGTSLVERPRVACQEHVGPVGQLLERRIGLGDEAGAAQQLDLEEAEAHAVGQHDRVQAGAELHERRGARAGSAGRTAGWPGLPRRTGPT